jgi:uncharacterized protein YodC (DUF2158 family)
MASKFEAGDMVQLKSGGPPMTIDAIPDQSRGPYNHQDEYLCIWFKGATKDQGHFGEHLLQTYVPPAKK